MITKTSRGDRVRGLLDYLFGPGRFNEHTDQHVVAVWDGWVAGHQPVAGAGGGLDAGPLADMLNADLEVLGMLGAKDSVWHTSVAITAEDGLLSDGQWAQVAEEMVVAAGLEDDAKGAVRWVAVRHGLSRNGNDHIHIVAALAGVDGVGRTRPRLFLGDRKAGGDYAAMRAAANRLEKLWGLTATSPATGATGRGGTRAELEIAARAGVEPARARLERVVRSAAVRVGSAGEMSAELARSGVTAQFVRPSEHRVGTFLGVVFSCESDRAADGSPLRFSGGKLAKDLTAPALQARWDTANRARGVPLGGGDPVGSFTDAVVAATGSVPSAGRAVAHAQAAAAADGLWVLAEAAEAEGWGRWHEAAALAARAAREPAGRPPVVDQACGIARAARGMSGLELPARGTTRRERELARAYLAVSRLLRAWAGLERAGTARVLRAQADRINQTAMTTAATAAGTVAGVGPVAHVGANPAIARARDNQQTAVRSPGAARGRGA